MSWIKLDDRSPWHPKIDQLSDRAFRWWIKGLCFASQYLTDGSLPYSFLKTVPKAVRAELRKRRLWVTQESGDVLVHDYLKHQSSRVSVEAERERNRKRKRSGTAGTPAGVPEPDYREQRTEVLPPNPPASGGRKRRLPKAVVRGLGPLPIESGETYAQWRQRQRASQEKTA